MLQIHEEILRKYVEREYKDMIQYMVETCELNERYKNGEDSKKKKEYLSILKYMARREG